MSIYTPLGFKRLVISFYAKINNLLNQCNYHNHIRANTFNLIRNVGEGVNLQMEAYWES